MSSAAALNVVRQIQALAEGPETPEMRSCLGQIVSSLQYFLEHPDSRVRMGAAKTLLKLKRGYPSEVAAQDLQRVRDARRKCAEGIAKGTAAEDAEQLRAILEQLLEETPSTASTEANTPQGTLSRAPVETAQPALRGEVVINVGDAADGRVKAGILERIVSISGVLSVTFNDSYVIINTRTPTIAADASFLADILLAVKTQGLQGAQLVSAAAAAIGGSALGGGAPSSWAAAASTAAASPPRDCAPPAAVQVGSTTQSSPSREGRASGTNAEAKLEATTFAIGDDDDEPYCLNDGPLDGDDGEIAYLDDRPDGDSDAFLRQQQAQGAAPPAIALGGGYPGAPCGGVLMPPAYSFFAQAHWTSARRIAERDDDPSIAARLRKAKAKEAERKKEEASTLGRLTSWWAGR